MKEQGNEKFMLSRLMGKDVDASSFPLKRTKPRGSQPSHNSNYRVDWKTTVVRKVKVWVPLKLAKLQS